MKHLVIIGLLGFSIILHAQKDKAQAYVNAYKDLAITEMQRTGVPASITLAQGILESQSGESKLALKSNNHFGIKCKPEWTGERTYHDDDTRQECFRVYSSAEDSYRDHSDFLKNREYYTALFKLDPKDDAGWAIGLKKAGYATDKSYPTRLLKIIEDYQLHQYSEMALNEDAGITSNSNITQNTSQNLNNYASQKNNSKKLRVINQTNITYVENDPAKATITSQEKMDLLVNNTNFETEEQEKNTVGKTTQQIQNTTNTKSTYPTTVFSINHANVIYASSGTSTLSIANKYGISLSKLMEFNELEEIDILMYDQLIFLEKKLKKGANDFYQSVGKESLVYISQKEGVRLESLMEYNNLKRESVLTNGQKIYLRGMPSNVKNTIKQPI